MSICRTRSNFVERPLERISKTWRLDFPRGSSGFVLAGGDTDLRVFECVGAIGSVTGDGPPTLTDMFVYGTASLRLRSH